MNPKKTLTRTSLKVVVVALALTGCSSSPETKEIPAQEVTSHQSACKPQTRMDQAADELASAASISASIEDGVLSLVHEDAVYNCASTLEIELQLQGETIVAHEVITNPGALAARCICNYDLSATLSGLSDGAYELEVVDADGQVIWQGTVQAGQAQSELAVSATDQSECKEAVDGADPGEADGPGAPLAQPMVLTAGAGSIEVQHVDAHENCAAKLRMDVTVSGQDIEVREVVTNPDEQADCMCDFDLAVTVSGLAPGTYQVRLIDSSGNEVGSQSVVVAS